MSNLKCDGEKTCAGIVTHIDNKGWIYCSAHGERFKLHRPCRKLTGSELTSLVQGTPISYRNKSK